MYFVDVLPLPGVSLFLFFLSFFLFRKDHKYSQRLDSHMCYIHNHEETKEPDIGLSPSVQSN
mgnify:FL=1|jgi:hypothetical protein